MGIIKAIGQAIKGGFGDQWLEIIEPDNMGEQTVFCRGIKTRNGQNVKGTDDTVSNGSLIRVYENQFMLLVDGGKVVDYTAEPGYYKVDNSSMPSLLNGEFGDTLKEAFDRVKFGGNSPREQKVYYINLQEIKGIKFGTRNPINYFDAFYNAELFIRAHGTYSIKIVNPLQFYAEAVPRNKDYVDINEINEQYVSEFLQALQASINQMSADGTRISHVTSKALELGKYMSSVLDQDWNQMRGMEIQAVGIASISYDEKSQELINLRNEGAMLSDPNIQRGYMVGHMARGMEAAGSNEGGAMNSFLGMGMGMNMQGNILGQMPVATPQQAAPQAAVFAAAPQQAPAQPVDAPVAQPAANTWTCECGSVNTGKFCPECGKAAPAADWVCECGTTNSGKFCSECGKPRA
ncbi:MAG: SPFH domain-containing protein [Agathobacter sp.]|nr:SPFH domain-containing protein [Agathobacter sp.]MBQ6812516.1 SPFH domain-containing protein [Agathobacter sp.]